MFPKTAARPRASSGLRVARVLPLGHLRVPGGTGIRGTELHLDSTITSTQSVSLVLRAAAMDAVSSHPDESSSGGCYGTC